MDFVKTISLFVFFVIITPALSTASDVVVFDSDMQFNYAKKCYEEKDYLSTIVELKKFKSIFPNDPKIEEAGFFIGMSWYNGGKFAEAIKVFEKIIDNHTLAQKQVDSRVYFMLARCHVVSGNPVMGEIVLNNYIKLCDSDDEKDNARNTIGWIRFETSKWEKSRAIFLEINDQNKEKYNVNFILSQIDDVKNLDLKNPKLAGTLAVIPGAGYVYTSRYQDAFISFLLNGALIYSAYEAFNHDYYALGGVISFVGFGFYSGSIYGSVSSAHKYNRKTRRKFINQTKKDLPASLQLGILPDFNRKKFALALRFQF